MKVRTNNASSLTLANVAEVIRAHSVIDHVPKDTPYVKPEIRDIRDKLPDERLLASEMKNPEFRDPFLWDASRFLITAGYCSSQRDFYTNSYLWHKYLVGGGRRTTLLRYVGEDLSIQSGEDTFQLVTNQVIGLQVHRKTTEFSAQKLRGVLTEREKGSTPQQVYLNHKSELPRTWDEIRIQPETETRGADAAFLILIEIDPRLRGIKLNQILLSSMADFYRERGIHHLAAYVRMPQMKKTMEKELGLTATEKLSLRDQEAQEGILDKESSKKLQAYVLRERGDGMHPDYGIRFHQRMGGRIICGMPFAVMDDKDSCRHACLMVYEDNLWHPQI